MKLHRFLFSGGSLRTQVEGLTNLNGQDLVTLFLQGSVWQGNKRIRDPDEVLPPGAIQVFQPDKPIVPFLLDPKSIVFEDDHILVVYKPSNLNSVQSPFSDLDNLTHGVQTYLDAGQGLENRHQVNGVHRLDAPAQGLIHYGKSKEAEKRLSALFYSRRIRKVYLALIPHLESQDGYFFRDELSWKDKPKRACSWFKRLVSGDSLDLWAASPLTGRPHQLRKHAAKYLHPIEGDVMYGAYSIPQELRLASVYSRFLHPFTGRRVEFFRLPPWPEISDDLRPEVFPGLPVGF